MLRISKLTDYATVILAHLAEAGRPAHAAPSSADRTQASRSEAIAGGPVVVAGAAPGEVADRGVPPGDPVRLAAAEVAQATGIGVATVSKLLKELQRAGLVVSTRGARGGYALARPAASISAADIIDAVEGPVALTECATATGQCGIEGSCRVERSWQRVNVAIRRALHDVKLTQLTGRDGSAIAVPDLGAALDGGAARRATWRVRA